jgi:hypothetical protein
MQTSSALAQGIAKKQIASLRFIGRLDTNANTGDLEKM